MDGVNYQGCINLEQKPESGVNTNRLREDFECISHHVQFFSRAVLSDIEIERS